MTSSRPQRLARGAATATFATFAALCAHIAGGGSMPALLGIAAPLILSIAACTFLSGRRLSPVRLLTSVGVAQALFHLLFVLGTPGGAASAHQHASAHDSASAHDTAVALDALPLAHAHAHESAGLSMWMGHALAVFITAAVLFWAERVLDAVAALAARLRSRALRSLTILAAARPLVAPTGSTFVEKARPLLEPRESRASRRGPPIAVA